MTGQTDDLLAGFAPVSLDALDQRAALQRRVDRKYLVAEAILVELLAALREDHDVLDIEGRRSSAYHSVYFDTADLLCFREHVEGHKPRFKARTRHYVDTDLCHFEVKVKLADGGTSKQRHDHDPVRRDQLTDAAQAFLDEQLRHRADRTAPEGLRPVLTTSFERMTLAAREVPARLTCDALLRLARPDGDTAALAEGHRLLETKSSDGDSPADRALARAGVQDISLSKYRLGVGMLHDEADDPDPPLDGEAGRLFTVT
ncbi:MAG TPA: polyphosphate polymerase domain-containing protein [Solirubrobacteraceae bacterium]|nr:polyphosphate polymerase domain-containing protein [Solirubrobacteraceae bacterium]